MNAITVVSLKILHFNVFEVYSDVNNYSNVSRVNFREREICMTIEYTGFELDFCLAYALIPCKFARKISSKQTEI